MEFFGHHGLAPSKVALAVSGGVDSTALLVMLAGWSARPFELLAVHVDHHLRGEESDGDRLFVEQICQELGVLLQVIDAPPDAELIRSTGVESAARIARREALLTAAHSAGAELIALAHHADDQAESVLLALLRGGGARRLAGMRAVDPPIVRPLLHHTRRELEQFLENRGIVPRNDSTNAETRFLRNRIRHEVLPMLETIQPRIREHLEETAEQLRELEGIVSTAEAAFRNAYVSRTATEVAIRSEALRSDSHLFRRVLLDEAFAMDPTARELTAADLRGTEEKLRAGAHRITLTRALEVTADGQMIRLHQREPEESVPRVELPVPIGEAIEWPLLDWRISVESLNEDDGSRDPLRHTFSLPEQAPLVLRNRLAGDRFHQFGLPAPKKLKELLINRKIDRAMRDRLPLLVYRETIVWIGGIALAAPFAIHSESRHFYRVSVTRASLEDSSRGMSQ